MSAQEQELDELLAMLHPHTHGLFSRIRAERDLYKARYEWLKRLCGIGKQDSVENWCALRGWDSVIVEKNCDTVDEAVTHQAGTFAPVRTGNQERHHDSR